jgi:hypothetical protein
MPVNVETKYDSLQAIRDAVEANGNVLSVIMWSVRGAYGAERLKVNVRANIQKQLAGLGLGHIPAEIPDDQMQVLRLFKLGSPVAELISAVDSPGAAEDELIREAVGGDAAAKIEEIRELVCA